MSKQEAEALTEEDTSVSEPVEVDENEDPFDSLEDDDTSFDDVEDTDSDDEDDEPSEPDDEEEPQEETEAESDEDEAEDSESVEEDTTSEQTEEVESDDSQESDEKTKQQIAHEAFKRREAERQLREEREAREKSNIDAYLEAARDDEQEYARRQTEVQRHQLSKERSVVLQDKLDVQINKAVNDLGLSKADKETMDFIGRQLDKFESGNVVKDQQGNIVEIKGDVYQYIKEEMDSISHFRNIGAREQTKKKSAEKTRTVLKPTRTPKEPKKDADLSDFDSEFYGDDE